MATPRYLGVDILLPLRPVDPFDPLRGQYLTLSYDINFPENLGLTELSNGQLVYTILAEKEGLYTPLFASLTPVTPKPGQVIIQGFVEGNRIIYGIEAYFMERGAILNSRIEHIQAKVKILPNGRASVIGLYKNGTPVQFTYRERTFLQK